jgi:hypothetical protein
MRFSLTGSTVKVNETAPDSTNPSDYITVANPPGIELYSARIDPTGELIYLTSDDGAPMQFSNLYVARRQGPATFGAPESVALTNIIAPVQLPLGAQVGGSTDPSLGIRRMPIAVLGEDGFDEYRETSPNAVTSFQFTSKVTIADLHVTSMRDPSFTPDGLRLVFTGMVANVNGIYTATRANIDAAWDPATLLRAGQPNDTQPYLTNDCKHLYWTRSGVTYHSVHP